MPVRSSNHCGIVRGIFALLAAAAVCAQGSAETLYLSLEGGAGETLRTDKRAKDLPNTSSVVTSEDLRLSNAKATTDILEDLPGVFVRKTSAFGRADMDIRGIGDSGRQVSVMIDGRPDKMGLFGCAVTHTLPFNNVERIEVLRGPESVLYGSEAFGGVVNIMTRKPRDKRETSVTMSTGEDRTNQLRLQQGGRFDRASYFVSGSRQTSGGHRPNSGYNASDLSAMAGFDFSPRTHLAVSGKYFGGLKNEPLPSAAGTWNDYERGSGDLTLSHKGDRASGTLKTYRSFGEHRFSDGFHSKDHTDGVMLHGALRPWAEAELRSGVDMRRQAGEILNTAPKSLIGRYHKEEYGVYALADQKLFSRVGLSAGARFNHDQYAGDSLVPSGGMTVEVVKGTALRGVWSRGFRAPQINDLYLWGGNKDLKAEKVVNTEGGIRQSLPGGGTADAAVFRMKGTDLIETRAGKKINVGQFEFRGVEASLDVPVFAFVGARLSGTLFDPGEKTTGRPKEKYNASLVCRKGPWAGLLTGEYVRRYYAGDHGTQRIPPFAVANAKVEWEPSWYSLFVAVDNLNNNEYQLYSGGLYTMPKRTVFAGTTVAF